MFDKPTSLRPYPKDEFLPDIHLRPNAELTQDELIERYALRRAIGRLRQCLPVLEEAMKRASLETGELHRIQAAYHGADLEISAFDNRIILDS